MKRTDKRFFFIVLSVCVAFVAVGVAFVYSVQERYHQDSLDFIADATSQEKRALTQKFDNDFQLLRGVSTTFSALDLTDTQITQAMLEQINYRNDFIRMGIATLDGKVDLVDIDGSRYRDVYLGDLQFFQEALRGEEAVSTTIPSRIDGRSVNYYAVPVYGAVDGGITGILVAVNEAGIYTEMLDVPVFQRQGFFVTVDGEGNVVIPSQGANHGFSAGQPLASLFTSNETELEGLLGALATDGQSFANVTIGAEEHVVCALPLEVRDWSLISVVPASTITGYFIQTSSGAAFIVLFATFIFAILLARQRSVSAKNQKALEFVAYTDLLTGLPNYAKFQIDAAELLAGRKQQPYALWSLDIRQFKNINDIFGHDVGDRLLKDFAHALAESTRAGSLCCRVSADNFAGISPYESLEDIGELFEGFVDMIVSRDYVPSDQMHISVAAGFYCLDDFEERPSVEDMVSRATIAKQGAKAEPGDVFAVFTPQMSEVVRRENELAASGMSALENGELSFHLQPKVSITDGYRVMGAEVLARWNHPDYGWISPGEFVPVFEKAGLITQFDRHIFREACAWYRAYQDKGLSPIRLAINVSRQGLASEDLVTHYTGVSREFGLESLELEFTESMVLEDFEHFTQTVRRLQQQGFFCSIDDFGSGYSSLNVLKSLPIDTLKLDAGFFRGDDDTTREKVIVQSLIAMVKRLSVQTVAEGIEEVAQVEFLKRVGCDVVQGYVFSRPLPPGEFEALMRETGGILSLETAGSID